MINALIQKKSVKCRGKHKVGINWFHRLFPSSACFCFWFRMKTICLRLSAS